MLATFLLINCTANTGPTSTPAPPSEAPWEQCLPVGSLSTRGFSKLKCFHELKYSYQKLNIWKPKSPGINRQLSLHRADLHSPTHFSLLTLQHLKAKDCCLILKCINTCPRSKHSFSSLPKPGLLLPMGSPNPKYLSDLALHSTFPQCCICSN